MSVWISIEHAPKDGTAVDLWGTDQESGGTPALWRNARWYAGHVGHCDVGHDRPPIEAWFIVEDGYRIRIWPSHYMEIPAGPSIP